MSPRSVDRLNIGLMLLALAAACVLPFEVFLFSYAVLGPLHYLTEISWLGERRFFTHSRFDVLWLAVPALLIALGHPFVLGAQHIEALRSSSSPLVCLSFVLAFVLWRFAGRLDRAIAIGAVLAIGVAFVPVAPRAWMLAALFLSTLLHVCVFTGAFMLFGALKARSRTGYVACAVFSACCVAAFVLPASSRASAHPYVTASYTSFAGMNVELARLFDLGTSGAVPAGARGPWWPFASYEALFTSATGIAVMRFIAFAYTYHYLNWFSKTSIIRWHAVDRRKLVAALVLWIGSLALYASSYELGARWLFLLSMTHVTLEFPLNHMSFAGIASELSARIAGQRGAAS